MQQSRKTEFWVGCFVIVGIAALLTLRFKSPMFSDGGGQTPISSPQNSTILAG